MPTKIFITGTDTHIGKTYISVGLLNAYRQQGYSTLGIKPIASGADSYNSDALALQAASTIQLPYKEINPFLFTQAIAPNIAAELTNTTLSVASLNEKTKAILNSTADVIIIEGVGGSHVPLNHTETMSDWVATQQFQTILVVGLRLGCLNHAILTLRALQADKINVIGWIGNVIDPNMPMLNENITTLKKILPIPNLAIVQHQGKVELL